MTTSSGRLSETTRRGARNGAVVGVVLGGLSLLGEFERSSIVDILGMWATIGLLGAIVGAGISKLIGCLRRTNFL